MTANPQTLFGAFVVLLTIAAVLAVWLWPQTSVTRDVLLRAADRDADAEGLDAPQRRELHRRAERYALDVYEGRITLGDALQRIACDAAVMRRAAPNASRGMLS